MARAKVRAKKRIVGIYPGHARAMLYLFPFIVLFAVFFTQRDSTTASSLSAPTVSHQAEPALGWAFADALVKNRDSYRHASGRDGFPEWSSYTREYFLALTNRRTSVISWAQSQPTPPAVVFIGNIHVNPDGSNSPERVAEIDQLQQSVFHRLLTHSADADVIAFEEAGLDSVITPDRYVEHTQHVMFNMYGVSLPIEEIRGVVSRDRQPGTRAIYELTTPTIFGEEWPLYLETRLLTRGPPADPDSQRVLGELITSFDQLRSEIILIRTLEFLRSVHGHKGVIVQGDAHRSDIEALCTLYRVTFLGVPVN